MVESSQGAGNPVRVVHMTSVHPRNDVRILLKECRSLAADGFEVTLIVADGHGPETRDGVKIVDAGARSSGRAGRALLTAARVYRIARAMRAPIYHFHDPELIPWGVLLRFGGARVVYDAHENLPHDILAKRYLPAAARWALSGIVNPLELLAARALGSVVAATPDIEARFRSVALHPGVYNFPLDGELAQPGEWRGRQAQACYIGGISVDRGVRQMVEAARHCAARIVLAGPLWDGLTLEAARQLPGWAQVDYRGQIGRAEVAALMGASRVGLVTFQPTSGNVNALPNKLFEYMSAGIPVVAADFPGWRAIVEGTQCGLCVDPRDPVAIAAAIDRLTQDEEYAARCGRNGIEAVARHYNWSTQARKLADLYRRLLY